MRYAIEQTVYVEQWLKHSKNRAYNPRLMARFQRIRNGNFGDYKALGNGLFELRFFFGSGLRIYYTVRGGNVVFLLVGGDKSTQQRDIKKATAFMNELEL